MNESKKTIDVVAAIIRQDDKLFATQRGYGEWKDWWEFPGGKVESGETHEDALRREIREELATEIEVGNLLTTVEYDYPQFHLTMHCYLCSIVSGQLSLLEHEDARWLGMDELDSVRWLPADVEVVKLIKRNKSNLWFPDNFALYFGKNSNVLGLDFGENSNVLGLDFGNYN